MINIRKFRRVLQLNLVQLILDGWEHIFKNYVP